MNKTISFIISLIKSAVNGSVAEVPVEIEWTEVWKIGKTYQLLPLMYSGVENSKISVPDELKQKAEQFLLNNLFYDQRQSHVLSELQSLFDENGIDYMPIKGILLKELYPSTELRPMGDGDILIRLDQFDKIKALMEKHGYQFRCESAHEYIYNKNGVCIELHKHLIPPYNKDYHSYYGNGWKLAQHESGTRHLLSDNDHYIYLFTHLAKHYRDGGVGPIHLVDLWVYSRKKELDFDYINTELEKLKLAEFHKNILATMDVWFEGAKESEITEFITHRFFNYGNFGTRETHSVAAATKVSKSTSVKGIGYKKGIRTLFPGVEVMQYRYPILKKHALLLPFCWGHRFFSTLFFKRGRLKDRFDEIRYTTEEKVLAYRDELDMVGLDFNFKE